MEFDPNSASPADSGVFGLPYSLEESKVVLLPVPWEATTSYGGGTSKGPAAIFGASRQVDLYDYELGRFYENGIFMLPENRQIRAWNTAAKKTAQSVIKAAGQTVKNAKLRAALKQVNVLSEKVNGFVYQETKKYLDAGKIAAVVGGDHSVPFGAFQAYLEKYPKMAILHFDAHADLRDAYEGFEHSHASIMHNTIAKTGLEKLVQIGIRDFCEAERDFAGENRHRVRIFFDQDLAHARFEGKTWERQCEEIVNELPEHVYISFDIDGLDPQFCPHTGTPVPGGLSFNEAVYLMGKVTAGGRKIVGFDLNEVAPGPKGDEWDANVGARLLYKMCGWALRSQGIN